MMACPTCSAGLTRMLRIFTSALLLRDALLRANRTDRASASLASRRAKKWGMENGGWLGWHHLSNATCLIQASFVLCVCFRVKGHRNLLHDSPVLKKTCVRQVVLDKWFPLDGSMCAKWGASFLQTSRMARSRGGAAGLFTEASERFARRHFDVWP